MKIIFPLHLYQKLTAYVTCIKEEIGGFGKIRLEGEDIVIEDIQIFPQVVNDAHVKIDQLGLAKFFDELVAKGEKIGQWKLWWHSHADFDAFFSGPDEQTITDFDNETTENNWILALVINQKGVYQTKLKVFQPFPFTETGLELVIQYPEYPLLDEVIADINAKVTVERFDIKKSNWPWAGKGKSGFDNGIVGEDDEYVHALPETVPATPIDQNTYDTEFDWKKEYKKKYKNKKRRQ